MSTSPTNPDQIVAKGAGALEFDLLESDYWLRDGRRMHVRPIRPTDEELQREMFYSLSPESTMCPSPFHKGEERRA